MLVTIQRSNTIDNQLFWAMVSTNDWGKISYINAPAVFHLNSFRQRSRAFSKKHTTFWKRGRQLPILPQFGVTRKHH